MEQDRPTPLVARRLAAVLILLAAILTGCAESDGTAAPTRGSPVPAGTPASPRAQPSPSAAPDGAPATPELGGNGARSPWATIPEIVGYVQPSVVSIRRDGGEGSGVIWSEDGIVVTNHHVVQGVEQVVVAFADGTRADGEVLASDPLSDLAIVRVDRDGLPAAQFADAIPDVGSLAVAMGNPLGFENSVTAGIISGTQRAIPGAAQRAPALVDLIQTDAAISPGNSGGALVGADGRLIGINVAYIPPQAGSVSIGFAIPATTVVDVVEQLLEDGTAEHTWLGVRPAPLTPQIAQRFDIDRDGGALVVAVVPGGPADEAGIEAGDLIVAVGDQRVDTVEDLLSALRRRDIGDRTTVRVVRDGEERDLEVTLGALPQAP